MQCPTERWSVDLGALSDIANLTSVGPTSYYYDAGCWLEILDKPGGLPQPATVPGIYDADGDASGSCADVQAGTWVPEPNADVTPEDACRHAEGLNVGWMDGHAKWARCPLPFVPLP